MIRQWKCRNRVMVIADWRDWPATGKVRKKWNLRRGIRRAESLWAVSRVGWRSMVLPSSSTTNRSVTVTITFTGHGVYTYDPKEDLYTLSLVRLHGRAPGDLQRESSRATSSSSRTAGPTHVRLTYDLSEAGLSQHEHGNVARTGGLESLLRRAIETRLSLRRDGLPRVPDMRKHVPPRLTTIPCATR